MHLDTNEHAQKQRKEKIDGTKKTGAHQEQHQSMSGSTQQIQSHAKELNPNSATTYRTNSDKPKKYNITWKANQKMEGKTEQCTAGGHRQA